MRIINSEERKTSPKIKSSSKKFLIRKSQALTSSASPDGTSQMPDERELIIKNSNMIETFAFPCAYEKKLSSVREKELCFLLKLIMNSDEAFEGERERESGCGCDVK
jgi:hypothetical protein